MDSFSRAVDVLCVGIILMSVIALVAHLVSMRIRKAEHKARMDALDHERQQLH